MSLLSFKIPIRTKIKIPLRVYKSALLLLFFGLTTFLVDKNTTFRAFYYLLIPISVFFLLLKRNLTYKINKDYTVYFLYVALWISVALLSLVLNYGEISMLQFVKEFGFISFSLLVPIFVISFSNKENILKASKYLILLYVALTLVFNSHKILALAHLNIVELIATSKGLAENNLSFVAGIIGIFFLVNKKWSLFWVCLLLSVLGSKRIVLASIAFTVMIYFILKNHYALIKRYRTAFSLIAVAANLTILVILILLARGYFEKLFMEYLGLPTNFVFMGRTALYNGMLNVIGYPAMVPKGLAHTSTVLINGEIPVTILTLMHSDILKFALELGVPFFSILIFLIYYFCSNNLKALCYLLFYNTLMVSDNVSIYFEVMCLIYLFILAEFKTKNVSSPYSAH